VNGPAKVDWTRLAQQSGPHLRLPPEQNPYRWRGKHVARHGVEVAIANGLRGCEGWKWGAKKWGAKKWGANGLRGCEGWKWGTPSDAGAKALSVQGPSQPTRF
jgi:hypothetical protein